MPSIPNVADSDQVSPAGRGKGATAASHVKASATTCPSCSRKEYRRIFNATTQKKGQSGLISHSNPFAGDGSARLNGSELRNRRFWEMLELASVFGEVVCNLAFQVGCRSQTWTGSCGEWVLHYRRQHMKWLNNYMRTIASLSGVRRTFRGSCNCLSAVMMPLLTLSFRGGAAA